MWKKVRKKAFINKLEFINDDKTGKFNFKNKASDIVAQKLKAEKEVPKSLFEATHGFKYNYEEETDDEGKYLTNINRKFYKWNQQKQKEHVMRLWRTLFAKLMGCSVIIN